MTITLDSWQPVLVAVIGLLAAIVPVWLQARNASRNAKAASTAVSHAVDTATDLGNKVDQLGATAQTHTDKLNQIGVAMNGERTRAQAEIDRGRREQEAARKEIERLKQQLFEQNNPPRET